MSFSNQCGPGARDYQFESRSKARDLIIGYRSFEPMAAARRPNRGQLPDFETGHARPVAKIRFGSLFAMIGRWLFGQPPVGEPAGPAFTTFASDEISNAARDDTSNANTPRSQHRLAA